MSDWPLVLIACGKSKAPGPQRRMARELYTGDLFLKSMAYARALKAQVIILSARYGAIDPCRSIEPYESTLIGMSQEDRAKWAQDVIDYLNMRKMLTPARRVIVLAGTEYRRDLLAPLKATGAEVHVPLAGLGIGRQKQWLRGRADHV